MLFPPYIPAFYDVISLHDYVLMGISLPCQSMKSDWLESQSYLKNYFLEREMRFYLLVQRLRERNYTELNCLGLW